jgi:hypothetical protein
VRLYKDTLSSCYLSSAVCLEEQEPLAKLSPFNIDINFPLSPSSSARPSNHFPGFNFTIQNSQTKQASSI